MNTAHQHEFDPALKPIAGRDIAASGGPHPIAVIGARADDEICFATVAWSMPVSHKPPMVAFALRAKSRTFQLLQQARRFSISTPDAALEDAVNECGNKTGNTVDKSTLVEWMLLPENDDTALPALAGALTVLDCRMESAQPAGDHMLVVGSVERAWSRAGSDDRGRIDPTDALLCVQHDLFATVR